MVIYTIIFIFTFPTFSKSNHPLFHQKKKKKKKKKKK